MLQRKLGVDILVAGHTHKYNARMRGELVPQPWIYHWRVQQFASETIPSFILMSITDNKVTTTVRVAQG